MISGTRVIDAHGHVGNWEVLGMRDDAGEVLRTMDRAGIDVAVVFGIFHPEGRRSNDDAAAFVAAHPDRFAALAYASPLMPGSMVSELTRAIDDLGFLGVKIYPPYTPWPLDHEAWDPIYAFVHERGLPLLSHTDAGDVSRPAQLAAAARRFPRLPSSPATPATWSPPAPRRSRRPGSCPTTTSRPAPPTARPESSRSWWPPPGPTGCSSGPTNR